MPTAERPGGRGPLTRLGSGLLWTLGTIGRVAVFGAIAAAVEAWDNWTMVTSGAEGGASMVFVVVAPLEAALAGSWSAVDAWRRASWTSVLVRWGVVALAAGLGVVLADLFAWSTDVEPSHEVAQLVFQLMFVAGGAAAGAGIMKAAMMMAPQDEPARRT